MKAALRPITTPPSLTASNTSRVAWSARRLSTDSSRAWASADSDVPDQDRERTKRSKPLGVTTSSSNWEISRELKR